MNLDISFLGYLAAFCTTCAFIPQVIHTLKSKDTSAISLGMYCLFVTGVALWLIYGLVLNNWPLIVANLITVVLSSIILIMKIKHQLNKTEHKH